MDLGSDCFSSLSLHMFYLYMRLVARNIKSMLPVKSDTNWSLLIFNFCIP